MNKTRVKCSHCSARFFLFESLNPCPHCRTAYSVKKGRKLNMDEMVGIQVSSEEENE